MSNLLPQVVEDICSEVWHGLCKAAASRSQDHTVRNARYFRTVQLLVKFGTFLAKACLLASGHAAVALIQSLLGQTSFRNSQGGGGDKVASTASALHWSEAPVG